MSVGWLLRNNAFITGITARELCHYFFDPDAGMEQKGIVEDVTVLKNIAPDTLLLKHVYKRVWPFAQRDALLWSHIRHLENDVSLLRSNAESVLETDSWMVCNQSTEHPDIPENQGECLRIGATTCFVCDTFIDKPYTIETAKRNNIKTKMTYCSLVNPGGWAPAPLLRAATKREGPLFLRQFAQYVADKTNNKPACW